MHLWLADRMVRLNLEAKQFFRLAHLWRFGKDAHTDHDALAYSVGGIIPQYVREYVDHIQQKEKDHAVQTVP